MGPSPLCGKVWHKRIVDKHLAQEVIRCLPRGKTRFDYFKDRYALLLLSRVLTCKTHISRLRQTRFGRLLEKPVVKRLLAASGDGTLRPEQVRNAWQEPSQPFLLTLSIWGGDELNWQQTSRRGYNLVLQLNFTNKHRRQYERLIKPKSPYIYICYGHPVMKPKEREFYRDTLAWARIDLDFSTDEALVEEVQTDWLRGTKWDLAYARRRPNADRPLPRAGATYEDIENYVTKTLAPYNKIWDEAMLSATIEFVRSELGIRTIYYHTFKGGSLWKNISYIQPPRSLYTDLPRKFCFERVADSPEFLQSKRHRKRQRNTRRLGWFRLEL